MITDTVSSWIEALPKVELHLHLEGSMSVETIAVLSARHGVDPSGIWPDGLPERFSFDGFPDFAAQFFYGLSLLHTGEDLATVTTDLATTLAGQNVLYAEVTTTAFTHFMGRDDRPGMTPADYRDGLNEGRRRASDLGVDISWVIDIPRDLERPDNSVTIDYLESADTPDGLVAIGLGGYEVGCPAEPFAPHFARARSLGLHSVPHAGETEGAHSIWAALDDLQAERIGHGVRCLEDPALVAELGERGTMLEVCPTSNDLLQVVSTLEDHPLPELRAAGVRVCLNTDDPGWFATDLNNELIVASRYLGVTPADHLAMQLDALAASFASADTRNAVAAELAAITLPASGH
ncbi:MAG: adenosine deaminase [Actinomycetia bacterium]|nr:adenosine deaminase [Actinomycetes bacterium]MCP5031402.1 adenosine deaminase [Actinomycetes bacterium]